jgi:lipid II:glycine glycyltransferase (peptidoglycan interpeptide bridge formation enzyme)
VKIEKFNKSLKAVEISIDEYNKLYFLCNNTNLLQCSSYVISKSNTEDLKYKFFKISDVNNNIISICSVLLKNLFKIGYVARINRGPILLAQFSNANNVDFDNFFFNSVLAVRNFGRNNSWLFLLIAPNYTLNNKNQYLNLKNGFFKRSIQKLGYCSSILDLNLSEELLFNNLQSKWRNLLRKSVKFNLSISSWNGDIDEINDLIREYELFKNNKSFSGVSSFLISELSKTFNEAKKSFNYFFVVDNNEVIGRLVTITHGDTCTYFIGLTNDVGRKYNVNYLLLWHSILKAKKSGCCYFDLGGINYASTPSIAKFKDGLSGVNYNLIGEFLSF